jgi:RNA polymerase-binding transcription factor DksA
MPLDSTQRNELIDLIDLEMARLRAEVQESRQAGLDNTYGSMTGEAHDDGDQSVADLLTDVEIAELKRDMNAIEALEAARGRLVSGVGGICVDCEEDIAIERLRANPAALRCRACQEQYEATHAGS